MSKPHALPAVLKLPGPLGGAPGFLWNYVPRTAWFAHFITINNNRNDAPIEEDVLGEVGSYGLQLGKVLDALDVLIEMVPRVERNKLSTRKIGQLDDLVERRRKVRAVTDQYP